MKSHDRLLAWFTGASLALFVALALAACDSSPTIPADTRCDAHVYSDGLKVDSIAFRNCR